MTVPPTSVADEQVLHRRLMRFGQDESLALPMWEEHGTSVQAIANHLASLYVSGSSLAGERVVTEKGLPHARASVLNLIVTVTDAAAADRVVGSLLGLGVRHPSRAIVLVPQPTSPGPPLDARITAHCNDASGGEEQVCYEEIVLTVRGEAATHLAGIVAPLLIHDLPTHMWWPGDPPFRNPIFEQLVEVGDRLLVDSSDFTDLLAGYRRLGMLRRHNGIGDLSWERLAWWQELTAQFFDAPRFRRYLPNLSRLRLRYAVASPDGTTGHDGDVAPGIPSPMSPALLYAGWIATRLGWKRYRTVAPLVDGGFHLRLEGRYEMVDLTVDAVETDALRPGELVSMHLGAFGETGAAEFIIDRYDGDAVVATNADGMTALLRRVRMETPREPELLSAQLAMDVVEPIYEDAVRAAAILLASAEESPR